jgi:hypothetical protein
MHKPKIGAMIEGIGFAPLAKFFRQLLTDRARQGYSDASQAGVTQR